jgi:hypothetical protein
MTTTSFVIPHLYPNRFGELGGGLHKQYFRNRVNGVSYPDPSKRSRIITSQSVGAIVPLRQYEKINSDLFIADYALRNTRCTWKYNTPAFYNHEPSAYSATSQCYTKQRQYMSLYDPMIEAQDASR